MDGLIPASIPQFYGSADDKNYVEWIRKAEN